MAAVDAVRVAAQARKHARLSMDRLIRYIEQGNQKGIAREVRFLNALDRQAVRQASRAAGVVARPKYASRLGERTLASLRNPASARYARSAMLASFSEEVMQSARDVAARGVDPWVWTANQSACSACLEMHGTVQRGAFAGLHPSCLCMPGRPEDGARPLSDREMGQLMVNRGGRDAVLGRALLEGLMSRGQLVRTLPNGQRVQRNLRPPPSVVRALLSDDEAAAS